MHSSRSANREHHWDALRALLMLLGLPYHVALTYRTGEVWIVNAHEGVPLMAGFAAFIHLFRMPAFFVIAGYFSALLLSRRPAGDWLRGRMRRLAIPLFVALLTLNPLLNYACELSNFSPDDAARSWLLNSSTSGGYWIRHLWFLIVLLYFSAAVAALVAIHPGRAHWRMKPRSDGWAARHFVSIWFTLSILIAAWEAVSIELFYMAGLATNLPQQVLRLDETLQYLPYFILGLLLARAPLFGARLYRLHPAMVIAAVIFAGLSLLYSKMLWPPYGRFLETMAALCLIQPILAVLRHFAARPSKAVRQLVDGSFVVYLFHLPILCGLVVLFIPLAVPVWLKAVLVLILTSLLSWLAWEIVSRVPLLRLAYDGIVMRRQRRPAARLATI
ncbi:MAG: acyltransferase family protein [Sphingobium sp.]